MIKLYDKISLRKLYDKIIDESVWENSLEVADKLLSWNLTVPIPIDSSNQIPHLILIPHTI